MPKFFAQLELRFPKWMQGTRAPAKKTNPALTEGKSDPGMTVWCQEQARAFGLPELARKVTVIWNARMRTTAGRAWWPSRQIEINPKLRELSDTEVWRTLKHEFAHLMAYERNTRRRIDPHGIEWQSACCELGIAGENARHSLPLKSRRLKRKHAYACPCCLAVIKRVRPIRRTVACYSCCKKYNNGNYDARFKLIKNKL